MCMKGITSSDWGNKSPDVVSTSGVERSWWISCYSHNKESDRASPELSLY